jgi:Family of unknown function (DUF5706)
MRISKRMELSYHESAGSYLKKYHELNSEDGIQFRYRFIIRLVKEAKLISESVGLQGMDYENAIVATCFRFAGFKDVGTGQTESMLAILEEYFMESDYPENDRAIVKSVIKNISVFFYAESLVEQVVSDAVYSMLADPDFLENLMLIKEELFLASSVERPELFYLKYFLSLFIKIRYYTDYANEKYARDRRRNFELVETRIRHIEGEHENGKKEKKDKLKPETPLLTNKETEDLFKIAFRNYNHMISVADSKASLLMRVNSVIISIIIAFFVGKGGRILTAIWPAIILMTVCMITIFLAILASRPQNNSFLEDKKSHSYQRFYFGSFDMVDSSFLHASWEEYFKQLMDLFSLPKETVYMEVYKESYNVRRVLAKKFNYLSLAYWVFLLGIFISVIAFVLTLYKLK